MVALVRTLTLVSALLVSVVAQDGSLTNVTGTWVMLVGGHQIGLELEQTDTKVEGVMHAMSQLILLVGD
jgi:hypothetical protein